MRSRSGVMLQDYIMTLVLTAVILPSAVLLFLSMAGWVHEGSVDAARTMSAIRFSAVEATMRRDLVEARNIQIPAHKMEIAFDVSDGSNIVYHLAEGKLWRMKDGENTAILSDVETVTFTHLENGQIEVFLRLDPQHGQPHGVLEYRFRVHPRY